MSRDWTAAVVETARQMGLKKDELSPDRLGAITLVRAGAELARHVKSSQTARSTLLAWARLVDASVAAPLVSQLIDEAQTTASPGWLSAYAQSVAASDFPPQMVVLGLLLLQPPERPKSGPAWVYLDEVVTQLGLPRESLEPLMGWLAASASPDVVTTVEAQLSQAGRVSSSAASVVNIAREVARVSRDARVGAGFVSLFPAAREKLRKTAEHVLAHAEDFGLDRTGLTRLIEQIDSDHFRLAVLGEFKRGKSTLINALVQQPGLLPADILPCTSALTELRYGHEPTFEVRSPGSNDYMLRDATHFREGVANAAVNVGRSERSTRVAEEIPRWRVSIPSEFLRQALVDVVDTPGLGEDRGRDFLAKQEAQRADAAIVVLDATQAASLQELELVLEMGAKHENLIIAINRADLIPKADWPRVAKHVETRLADNNAPMQSDRIVFVSAAEAEKASAAGRPNEWSELFGALRRVVREHLIVTAGQRKAVVLAKSVLGVVKSSRAAVKGHVAVRRHALERIENLEASAAEARDLFEGARRNIAEAEEVLKLNQRTADALRVGFAESLTQILADVKREEGKWTSERSLVGSPKKHLEEVAKKAQQSVEVHIGRWIAGPGSKIVEEGLTRQIDEASERLQTLKAYLESAKGGDSEDLLAELRKRAAEDVAGRRLAIGEGGVVGAALRVAVTAAISLVIGYIVADVILYYVIGAISGFLNPWLLAAALLIGLPAYLLLGDDIARGWIRTSLFDKIQEELRSKEAMSKLAAAFERSTAEAFQKFATAFGRNAGEMIREVRFQQEIAEKELASRVAEFGDPQSIARELGRIERLAAEVEVALDQLESEARGVAKEAGE